MLSLGRSGAGFGELEALGWLCTPPAPIRGDTPHPGTEMNLLPPQRLGEIVIVYDLRGISFRKRKRGGIVKSSANKLDSLGFSILALSIHVRHFVVNKLWRLKKVQK